MAHLGAASAPGYHPRPATNDLKEIVEDSMEELLRVWDQRFRDTHGPLHSRVKDLLEAFVRCGDLHFGFVRVRCVTPGCPKKDEKAVPFSCKAMGLCPSCGQRRAIEWAERMVELVLPLVPYRQLVSIAGTPHWKRVRKARGPPPGAQSRAEPRAQGSPPDPPETIDLVIDDDAIQTENTVEEEQRRARQVLGMAQK